MADISPAAIATILDAEAPDLAYALLVGSHARGEARADSDVDIAVRGAGPLPWRVVVRLQAALELALATQVDVIDLATASTALAFRCHRDGKILTQRDEASRKRDVADIIVQYGDFEQMERTMVQSVLGRGGG